MKSVAWKPEEHKWLLSIGLSFNRIFYLLIPLVLKWSGLVEGLVRKEEGSWAWQGQEDGEMLGMENEASGSV